MAKNHLIIIICYYKKLHGCIFFSLSQMNKNWDKDFYQPSLLDPAKAGSLVQWIWSFYMDKSKVPEKMHAQMMLFQNWTYFVFW